MRQLIFALLVGHALGALSQPNNLPPGVRGGGAGAATRSVAAYLDRERGLIGALEAGQRDTVQQMLDEGFEVRSATDADATPAADWLNAELRNAKANGGATVRNLAVREFDGIAVVNFLLDSTRVVNHRKTVATKYVVDVWRVNPHQLLVRYVSQPARVPPIPSRPTGRE